MLPTVNFHLIKACNYGCKFCYATFEDIKQKGLSEPEQYELMRLLAQSTKFRKINFAGGEPTLVPHIKKLIKHAKFLGFETSIVTNGSKIDAEWVKEMSSYLNILALSVDSIDDNTNLKSGRNEKGKVIPKEKLLEIAEVCHIYGIHFKVNTVVFKLNKLEYLTDFVNQLKPFRWKVLQVTRVEGQNDRQFDELKISDEEFENFCQSNEQKLLPDIKFVKEPANILQGSYLMIDMLGRFYDSSKGCHSYSKPILEVGVEQAMKEINVDIEKFTQREGNYSVTDETIKVEKYEKDI